VDTANTDVPPQAADAVTELYAAHAFGLVRLAVIMLGDRAAAEDVVQDAFLGLYRRWDSLAEASHPLGYVRTSVLNGCRSALRRQSRRRLAVGLSQPPGESAEALALVSEEHRAVVAAIRRLPERQREALLLRYYLEMSEDEIARAMRVSRGTVKSATSRALAALERTLTEDS
jgi:RNA polymerase sigma-70 factor (sigma-E family)